LKLVFDDFYDPVRATLLQQQQHIAAHMESLVIARSIPDHLHDVDGFSEIVDLTCATDVLDSSVNASTDAPRKRKEQMMCTTALSASVPTRGFVMCMCMTSSRVAHPGVSARRP
jgi:hypothetical protein